MDDTSSQRRGRAHGFGVRQRDSDPFGVDERDLGDVEWQARDAANLLLAHFRALGRWDAAVEAYNGGPDSVRRALGQGRPSSSGSTVSRTPTSSASARSSDSPEAGRGRLSAG